MAGLQWYHGGRISEQIIADAEEKIGRKFPRRYRDLVRENDGASPSRSTVVLWSQRTFNNLYTLVPNDFSPDLLRMYGLLKNRMPDDVIPFGHESMGDAFCFDYRHSAEPAVVYWDSYAAGSLYSEHDKKTADALADGSALLFIAPDFESFLRKLQEPDPKDEEYLRQVANSEERTLVMWRGKPMLIDKKKRRKD